MGGSSSDDFSVVVLASDLGVDARSLLSSAASDGVSQQQQQQDEVWHDCPSSLALDGQDFSDLEFLQAFRFEGYDKSGNRIFRIVGKFFPALVISGERLKKYIFHKIFTELPEGPFCIVYMHSTVQKEENSPGLSVLRWIYEGLPSDYKDRLRVLYFVHPGIRSRLVFATLGRFFLSGGLYWKIRYISRLQYLWEDIKKDQIEIPDFVQSHDDVLEHRPLTDYGIEPDPLHLTEEATSKLNLGHLRDGLLFLHHLLLLLVCCYYIFIQVVKKLGQMFGTCYSKGGSTGTIKTRKKKERKKVKEAPQNDLMLGPEL